MPNWVDIVVVVLEKEMFKSRESPSCKGVRSSIVYTYISLILLGCFVLSLVENVPVVLQCEKFTTTKKTQQRCQETELVKPVRSMRIKKNSKSYSFLRIRLFLHQDFNSFPRFTQLVHQRHELQSEKTIELCTGKLKERINCNPKVRVV